MDRFWSKVARTDNPAECWLWLAHKNKEGYGGFRLNGMNMRAHRVAYELMKGEVPKGMSVLHRCDNPACVNPEHLFLGTARDNTQDAIAKGRWTQMPSAWEAQAVYWNGLTQEQRSAHARRGAVARWSKPEAAETSALHKLTAEERSARGRAGALARWGK